MQQPAEMARVNTIGMRRPLERLKERIIQGLLALSLLAVILPVILILVLLLDKGLSAISWDFLTKDPIHGMTAGGIRPAILGTIYLVMLTLLLAVPTGVLAAIYLTEYARQNVVTRMIRLAIVNLAGVPSVVFGLFGLGLFVYMLNFGTSLLAGACTMAVLVLPLVITASEEALLTVPESFREASLALGASKWQTVLRVVLPSALPGILTGVILAVGRAAGETAPLLFTCVALYLPSMHYMPTLREVPAYVHDSLMGQVMALPYHLFTIATQVPGAPREIQWGTALVLLVLVLGMNLVAMVFRSHLRRGRKW